MSYQIQWRRDTAANWTSTNPTLSQGEVGLETDTSKIKVGDGATHWNTLAYWSTGASMTYPGSGIAVSTGTSWGTSATFGTAAGNVAQGNDSRILDGETAYGWGNHGTAHYVKGPASSTNNHVAFMDGTSGTLIKDSGLTLSGTNTGDQDVSGFVSGPASATNNHVAFMDGTSGKLIKDSGITLSGTNTGDQDLSGYALMTNVHNVPAGGATEQILSKIDGADYNTHWVDKPTGGAQTPWTSDINAANYKLGSAKEVGFTTQSGSPVYVASKHVLVGSGSTPLDVMTINGNGIYPIGIGPWMEADGSTAVANGDVLTYDASTDTFYPKPVSGAGQTPWDSDIDAANHKLTDLNAITWDTGAMTSYMKSDMAGETTFRHTDTSINATALVDYHYRDSGSNLASGDVLSWSGSVWRGYPFSGASQTPWGSNINAAGYNLSALGQLSFNSTYSNFQEVDGSGNMVFSDNFTSKTLSQLAAGAGSGAALIDSSNQPFTSGSIATIDTAQRILYGITASASNQDSVMKGESYYTPTYTNSGSYVLLDSFTITENGTLRVKWDMSADSSQDVFAKVYRNGVAVGVEKTTDQYTPVAMSDDISGWNIGDSCELWCYTAETSHNMTLTMFEACFTGYAQAVFNWHDLRFPTLACAGAVMTDSSGKIYIGSGGGGAFDDTSNILLNQLLGG